MQYVPGMIIFVIGLIRLVMSFFATDPAAKEARLKSALISIGIGVVLMIAFSTVLRR